MLPRLASLCIVVCLKLSTHAAASDAATLAEGLDWNESAFAAGGGSIWTYDAVAAPGQSDAIVAHLSPRFPEAWIETVVVGPGTFSCWAKFTDHSTLSARTRFGIRDAEGNWVTRMAPGDPFAPNPWNLYQFAITESGPVTLRFGGHAQYGLLRAETIAIDRFTYTQLPSIIEQPVSRVASGSSVSLSATALNATSLQWLKDGEPLAGADRAPYSLHSSLRDAIDGDYQLVATNAVGETRSQTVRVEWADNPGPALEQPTQFATLGGTTAWKTQSAITRDGVDALQARPTRPDRTAELSFYLPTPAALDFWWRANAGSITILQQGQIVRELVGEDIWKRAITPIDHSGTITIRYSSASAPRDPNASAYLDGLIIHPRPTLTITADQNDFAVGEAVEFISEFSASFPVHYQWTKDDVPIPGQTQPELKIQSAQTQDAGAYRLVASNGLIEASSNELTLAALDQAAALDTDGLKLTNLSGTIGIEPNDSVVGPSSLAINLAPGSRFAQSQLRLEKPAIVSFWWKLEEGPCPTELRFHHSASLLRGGEWHYVESEVAPAYPGFVNWTLSGRERCGARALIDGLQVNYVPLLANLPERVLVGRGEAVELRPRLVQEEPVTYQWFRDGQPIAGQTAAALDIATHDLSQPAEYRIDVTAATGAVYSKTVVVNTYETVNELVDTHNFTWTRSPAGTIAAVTDQSLDLEDALALKKAKEEESSWIETTVDGPFLLNFWWRINPTDASMRLSVDGVAVASLVAYDYSGEWTFAEYREDRSGPRALRWEARPSSSSPGSITGMLDRIAISPTCINVIRHPRSGRLLADGLLLDLAINGPNHTTFQWLESDKPIAGATASSYRASSPGNYSVIARSGSCEYRSSIATARHHADLEKYLPRPDLNWFARGDRNWDPQSFNFNGALRYELQPERYVSDELLSIGFELNGPQVASITYSSSRDDSAAKRILLDGTPYSDFLDGSNHRVIVPVSEARIHTIEFELEYWSSSDPSDDDSLYIQKVETAAAPVFESSPKAASAFIGQSVVFESAVVSAFPNTLTYQWAKSGHPIPGANESSLTIASVTPADAGAYSLTVTDALGSSASGPATLEVFADWSAAFPGFSGAIAASAPEDWILLPSSTPGGPPSVGFIRRPSDSWIEAYVDGPGVIEFLPKVSSAARRNSTCSDFFVTLNDAPIPVADDLITPIEVGEGRHSIRWILSSCSPTPYDGLTLATLRGLRFQAAATIALHPDSQVVWIGQPLKLVGQARGGEPHEYQWYRNNEPLAGATGREYSVPTSAYADAGDYHLVVTSPFGATESATASIQIAADPGAIIEIPGRVRISADSAPWVQDSATFTTGGSSLVSSSVDQPEEFAEFSVDAAGPVEISFDSLHSPYSNRLEFLIDGTVATPFDFSPASNQSWSRQSYLIRDSQVHRLTWRVSLASHWWSGNIPRVYVDNVEIDPIPADRPFRSYARWLEANLTDFAHANSVTYFDDPDRDGFDNYAEFNFGMDPLQSDAQLLPDVRNLRLRFDLVEGGAYPRAEFDSAAQLLYPQFEGSADMVSWDALPTLSQRSESSSSIHYKLSLDSTWAKETPPFIRVRISP